MLSLIGCTACTQVEDTSTTIDSSPTNDTDTGDTADTGPLVIPDVVFDQNQPGPYTEECTEEVFRGKDPDLVAMWITTEGWAAFVHAAQVLTAKFQAVLPSGTAPPLAQVCQELANELTTGNPGPVPIIGDCPALLPDTDVGVLNAIPSTPFNLQTFYQYDSNTSNPALVTGVSFANIAYEHPNHPDNYPLPEAMNAVEAIHGNPPGCWIKFDLVNEAAANPTLNSMPIVLFTNHAYLTAAILEADVPEQSLVISGATFTVPGPVASFLAGGPIASPSPVPYAELYLSVGYPPDATATLDMDEVDFSIMGTTNFDVPFETMPQLMGSGIIDPVTREDLRELDWAVTEHVEQILWDTDTSTTDTTSNAVWDTASRGNGMPALWPAEPDKR